MGLQDDAGRGHDRSRRQGNRQRVWRISWPRKATMMARRNCCSSVESPKVAAGGVRFARLHVSKLVPGDVLCPNSTTKRCRNWLAVFDRIDEQAVDAAVTVIAGAGRIALYGVGREGLQIKGFAMRLHHLGLKVAVVGDMTTPPLGDGDLLIVSAGPGGFSTVLGLMGVAAAASAQDACRHRAA